MTRSLDPHHVRAYRRRARPMMFLGALLLLVGVRGYFGPADADDTAAKEALGAVMYGIWHAGLTLSGALMMYGVLRLRPEVEVLGLWAAVWALAVHGVAVMIVFGFVSSPTIAVVLMAMWVLFGRIGDLYSFAVRGRRSRLQPPRGR